MTCAFSQNKLPYCEKVPQPLTNGETATFYIYAYQTNKFNEVLRVSPVFRVSYNYDRASRVDNSKIALRIGREFDQFVRGIREDSTQTIHEVALQTQQMGIFMCLNQDAVSEHRLQKIESFEKWDKRIIEEDEYEFKYRFNAYYKGATQVTIDKL
ncbi:MAG: hypothetical protein ACPGJS_17745 [Flammeovirgaceae bacterium]